MRWIEIPLQRGRRLTPAAVTVSVRRSTGKSTDTMYVHIGRPIAEPLGLVQGAHVVVDHDEAGGAIRIRPAPAGRAVSIKNGTAVVGFPPPWEARERRSAEPAQHQVLDQALVLTLPDWARPATTMVVAPPPAMVPATALAGGEIAVPTTAPEQASGREAESRKPEISPTERNPAPRPAPAGRLPQDRLTPEREALFRKLWARPAVTVSEVFRQVNALPGEPYGSSTSMYSLATRLGLSTNRMEGDEQQPPAPKPADSPASAQTADEDEREAEQLVIAGQGARYLADYFGWDLKRAQAFAAKVRARKAA